MFHGRYNTLLVAIYLVLVENMSRTRSEMHVIQKVPNDMRGKSIRHEG